MGQKLSICVYGAGRYAKKYIKKILQIYDVKNFFDVDEAKAGERIGDIIIKKPTTDNVNVYPILILLKNPEPAYESLKMLNCSQDIMCIITTGEEVGIIPYEKKDDKEYDINDIVLISKECEFGLENVHYTNQEYVNGKRRIFNMASPLDFNSTGGPCACLRNLYLANEEYKLIKNLYTICPSIAYVPRNSLVCQDNVEKDYNMDFLNFINSKSGASNKEALALKSYLCFCCDFLKKINELFCFTKNDVFLIQDIFLLYTFINMFPSMKNVDGAYHMQGTIRSENSKVFPTLGSIYDRIQLDSLKNVNKMIYPSKGTFYGVLDTASDEIKRTAIERGYHIAYNGYERKDVISSDEGFLEKLKTLIGEADVVFSSASHLYVNKGVERIPKVLRSFKEITGANIKWILIGNGEMEGEVEKSIEEFLEPQDYVWFKERFVNQDNVFELFNVSDFYIMMHRVSVFDLSTLQAMAYGCVPFLSNVGGNLELCGYNNGILVDPDKLTIELGMLQTMEGKVDKDRLDKLKNKNIDLIKNKFNNFEFLDSYKKILLD